MFRDGMALLVDVGYEGKGFKLLLSLETEAFFYFRQILDQFFSVHIVVGPLTEAISVPVLSARAMDHLQVVLVQACYLTSYHGLVHGVRLQP